MLENFYNGVVQILSSDRLFESSEPYVTSSTQNISGSGFVIDVVHGIVVTNSHVVRDSGNLQCKFQQFGAVLFVLRVISICIEKDLALCQLSQDAVDRLLKFAKPEEINLPFAESILPNLAEVIVVGYPLGFPTIKATKGVIAGYDQSRDCLESKPVGIQVTAPTNPGNSGGPLLNMEGKVIGIIYSRYSSFFGDVQNTNFAITSRCFLNLYPEMIKPLKENNLPKQIIPPKFGISYQGITQDMVNGTCGVKGLRVCEVFPNSSFPKLEAGDIITRIFYQDPFLDQNSFSVLDHRKPKTVKAEAVIDNYTLMTTEPYPLKRKKRIKLDELAESIPQGTTVTLEVCRKNKTISIPGTFVSSDAVKLHYVILNIKWPDYLVTAGMCLLDRYIRPWGKEPKQKDLFKPRVMIVNIFPGSTLEEFDIFKKKSHITKVNGQKVSYVREVKAILDNFKGENVVFEDQDDNVFTINRKKMEEENLLQLKNMSRNRTETCDCGNISNRKDN